MASDYEEIEKRIEDAKGFLRGKPGAVGALVLLTYPDNVTHIEVYVKKEYASSYLGSLVMLVDDLVQRFREMLGWTAQKSNDAVITIKN